MNAQVILHTDFLQWNVLVLFQQKCLSEVRGPLVDLGVSEYGILSAIATLSETQNDLGVNHQQPSNLPEPSYSADDITLFRQIALDLRELKHWDKLVVLVYARWMLSSVVNVAPTHYTQTDFRSEDLKTSVILEFVLFGRALLPNSPLSDGRESRSHRGSG